MAVTQEVNDVIRMTTALDAITDTKFVKRIRWNALAAAKQLIVTDTAGVVYIDATSTADNINFDWEICLPMKGVKIATLTTPGVILIQVS